MITVSTTAEIRSWVKRWRGMDERVAFVPTMGNLHAGHLALVEHAQRVADRVVVSIFVNPLQFGEGEDFDAYPRTLKEDQQKLIEAGVDCLFAPTEDVVYPDGREVSTRVEVPGLSDILCGAGRPGHFQGVTTVVAKLFNIVQPDVAIFGEKDYQQLMIIRRMVSDLFMDVAITALATKRVEDELAMSSRNQYLGEEARAIAPLLYKTLVQVQVQLEMGAREYDELEREGAQALSNGGFEVEYLRIRRAEDLAEPGEEEEKLVVLAAARLGRARLIDNIVVNLS